MKNYEKEFLKDKEDFYKAKYQKLRQDINHNAIDLNFKVSFNSKLKLILNKLIKKKKLNIIFIGDNKQIYLKYIFYNSKNYFKIKDKSYTFNEMHIYNYNGSPTLFLYENDPIPINFSNGSEINSTILNKLMETKFIFELLKKDEGFLGMKMNKNVLMIIAMILAFIFLFTQGFFNDIFTY